MNQYGITAIRDALHNLTKNSGASEEYKRGLVVGLVTGIMAGQAHFTYQTDFNSAWGEVQRQAQIGHRPIGLETLYQYAPPSWTQPQT